MFAGILPRLRLHAQRQNFEGPRLDVDVAVAYLDRPLRLFEQVDALGPLNAGGEAQGRGSARAVRLVEAQDHTPAVLRPLEAPERELHPINRYEPAPGGLASVRADNEGTVERERFSGHPGLRPVSGVGKEAVGEVVLALVGERVGVEGTPQKADAEHVLSDVVAVLAVVQEGDTVARLGEVGEAVGADFEAHLVPGGVAVGRALRDAVHRLEGRLVGAYSQGEERPQEYLPLSPVHGRLDVKTPRGGEQFVGLGDPGAAKAALDAHRAAQRP